MPRDGPYTIVFFHAHPDDEALLTAGTMARLAVEGHRVVLVVATAGEVGEAAAEYAEGPGLGERRRAELARSAEVLGCARTAVLGYGDSGLDGAAPGRSFVAVPVEESAAALAAVLREERADAVTVYDPHGGYGHPDHIRVHTVGTTAARLAGTPLVLEATVDRTPLVRAVRLLRLARLVPADVARSFAAAYSPRGALTHAVDVRAQADAKRAAMAAHASQATSGGGGDRTLAAFLRLPGPLFRLAFGREWYVEHGRRPGGALLDDVFATVRA